MKRAALVLILWTWTVGSLQAGDDYTLPDDHLLWSAPVFRSAYQIIATEEEWAILDTIPRERLSYYLKLFWKKRDPTPTTEANELRDQFVERVEVAVSRFRAIPRPTPWDERGNAYIRFGPPDDRVDEVHHWYAPEDTFRISHGMPNFTSTRREFGEIWYYNSRNLKLQFQGLGTDIELVPYVSPQGDYQLPWDFAETKAEVDTSSVAYIAPVGVEELSLALECYPFRREDGDYDVYVAAALPLRAIATYTSYPAAEIRYDIRLNVFDTALAVIWADSASVQREVDRVPRGMLAQNEWQRVVSSGLYIFTVEAGDGEGKKHAVSTFDRWLVPYIDSVQLELSPLVIAADVKPASESSTSFVRNGKEIVPMPGRVFKESQDIAFYHEVYNLARDRSGLCRYRIEYALYDAEQKRTLLTSKAMESAERSTFQAGRFPARRMGKGAFILEARTSDLIAGTTKTALTRFKVE